MYNLNCLISNQPSIYKKSKQTDGHQKKSNSQYLLLVKLCEYAIQVQSIAGQILFQ